ncbi:MAG: aminoacyl-tRNA hydrolase [Firmicutes bacterium]|nr:aminoacyl-tRNA hydrolase [Bacillota bacterium]
MYIICGLGNPGREYEATRHNMGLRTLDELARLLNVPVIQLKFKSIVGETRLAGQKLILLKPQTFMNNSGEALREAAAYYKVEPENILVIYDDTDLPVGSIRMRPFGSSGSHNGMKSVIYQLQSDQFPRLRVGIGSKGQLDMRDFVLGRFSDSEKEAVDAAIKQAALAAQCFVTDGLQEAMSRYNTKKDKPPKHKRVPEAEDPKEKEE